MQDLFIVVPALVTAGLLSEFAARKLQIPTIRMVGPIVLTAAMRYVGLAIEIPGIVKDVIPYI